MIRTINTLITAAVLLALSSFQVSAMDMHHNGEAIRTATVDGVSLNYTLIDMRESMKKMGHDHAMGAMATHHLMVYAKGPDGPVKGKAGFLVTGPDGKKEQVMAMAMGDGFGADITLAGHGTFTIKAKIAGHGKTLMDEFSYTLKH